MSEDEELLSGRRARSSASSFSSADFARSLSSNDEGNESPPIDEGGESPPPEEGGESPPITVPDFRHAELGETIQFEENDVRFGLYSPPRPDGNLTFVILPLEDGVTYAIEPTEGTEQAGLVSLLMVTEAGAPDMPDAPELQAGAIFYGPIGDADTPYNTVYYGGDLDAIISSGKAMGVSVHFIGLGVTFTPTTAPFSVNVA